MKYLNALLLAIIAGAAIVLATKEQTVVNTTTYAPMPHCPHVYTPNPPNTPWGTTISTADPSTTTTRITVEDMRKMVDEGSLTYTTA